MNWLKNFVKPKLKSFVGNQDSGEDLWYKCPSCEKMIFHNEFKNNFKVCQHCNFHSNMTPKERCDSLFDNKRYKIIKSPIVVEDPIKFIDLKKYSDRLQQYRKKTKYNDAIIVAEGKISGITSVVAVFNFSFMGGSMGMEVGESIVQAAELAIKNNGPLIIIPSSGGARMQEGILSLMQMPRTVIAISRLKEEKLPCINILVHPTTGGVSASFAMIADVTFAEPNATIGFTGARVIKETIGEKLPEGFQTSEYLLDHGMIDAVVSRKDLKNKIKIIIDLLCKNKEK